MKYPERPLIGEIVHLRNPNISFDKCRPAIVVGLPDEKKAIPVTIFSITQAPANGWAIFWHHAHDCEDSE